MDPKGWSSKIIAVNKARKKLNSSYQRFNGRLAILRERLRTVMHYTLIIILHAKVGYMCACVFVEVVRMPIEYILPVDLHVLIAFR